MTTHPIPKPRGRIKAMALLLGVYFVGIMTGVGGGLFVVQNQVRRAISNPPEGKAPVDYIFAKVENDIVRQASLTPPERAHLHERLQVLSGEFKQARIRLASELREAVRKEVDTVSSSVEPTRRERVRQVIRQKVERWGLDRSRIAPPAATPAPQKNL